VSDHSTLWPVWSQVVSPAHAEHHLGQRREGYLVHTYSDASHLQSPTNCFSPSSLLLMLLLTASPEHKGPSPVQQSVVNELHHVPPTVLSAALTQPVHCALLPMYFPTVTPANANAPPVLNSVSALMISVPRGAHCVLLR